MTISAAKVMELRNATGAGMMDCKRALVETGGDLDKAKDHLRKKGIAVAAKKSSRETKEGAIGIIIGEDAKRAAIVHLACETDFVARNELFTSLLDRLARQVLAKGEAGLPEQQLAEGSGTVQEMITEAISKMGENLQLVEAGRLQLDGEGMMGGYVHSNKRIGVLVMLKGAPRNEVTEKLAKDLAMHVAASQVEAVSAEGVDPDVLEKEREILTAQARESGKPENIIEKMVAGRVRKFVKEVALMEQSFVKDATKTVKEVVEESGKELGVEIAIERFLKYQF